MKLTTVVPGISADTLIHQAVFGKSDSPPPYSTDHKTAEWLIKSFDLRAEPIVDMEHTTWDIATGLRWGDVIGYMVCRLETFGEVGDEDMVIETRVASADTFPLAVCRAVLLIKQVVEDDVRYLGQP